MTTGPGTAPFTAGEVQNQDPAAGGRPVAAGVAVHAAGRAGRRRRTEILDLGLELCASSLRDLSAVAAGAEEVGFARDRLDALTAVAAGLDPARARRAASPAPAARR